MLIIRPATFEDVPALVALARRAWLSAFGDTLPTTAIRAWAAADRTSAWYVTHWPTMTVAEREGLILGLVQPAADEINGLWVDPAYQSQGVGTCLLAEAEHQIALAGYRRSWLHCSSRNSRAQQFYLARGYRFARTQASVLPDGSPEELLVYEKTPITTLSEA